MIEFYSDENQARTRFSNTFVQGKWGFQPRLDAYITELQYKTDDVINTMKGHLLETPIDSIDHDTIQKIIDELQGEKAAQYLIQGDKPKPLIECSDGNWECSYLNQKILDSNNNLRKPEFRDFDTSTKSINDRFNGHFHEYYMQSKQLNNFNCGFLPTFRALTAFLQGVPIGRVFGYFDIQTENFLIYLGEFVDFLKKSTPHQALAAFSVSWGSPTHRSYYYELNNYNTLMNSGKDFFNDILVHGDQFLDSLKIGLKVIAVANIVLTSSIEDEPVLRDHSAMSTTVFPSGSSSGIVSDEWLMVREVQAAAYCTQIGLQLKQRLKPDYSNFEFLVSKIVNITLDQFGITAIMENVIQDKNAQIGGN